MFRSTGLSLTTFAALLIASLVTGLPVQATAPCRINDPGQWAAVQRTDMERAGRLMLLHDLEGFITLAESGALTWLEGQTPFVIVGTARRLASDRYPFPLMLIRPDGQPTSFWTYGVKHYGPGCLNAAPIENY